MVIVYDTGGASALRMAGPGTVRLLAMTWTVHEPGTRDGAVQCTCTREATEYIYPSYTPTCLSSRGVGVILDFDSYNFFYE